MERGIPNLTVYTFEAAPGRELRYPDAELWTTDETEARTYAQEHGYLLMVSDYTEGDDGPELVEDFTPETRCRFCGVTIEQQENGLYVDPDYADSVLAENRVYCDESPDHTHGPELAGVHA